jgi:hypothetical protein
MHGYDKENHSKQRISVERAGNKPAAVLDFVHDNVVAFRSHLVELGKESKAQRRKVPRVSPAEEYLEVLAPDFYGHTMVARDIELASLAATTVLGDTDRWPYNE